MACVLQFFCAILLTCALFICGVACAFRKPCAKQFAPIYFFKVSVSVRKLVYLIFFVNACFLVKVKEVDSEYKVRNEQTFSVSFNFHYFQLRPIIGHK